MNNLKIKHSAILNAANNAAAVEKIKNYFATIVKQSRDAICIHDHEGKIIFWNEGAEKIYGYTEAEALKMTIWNIIPEHILPRVRAIVSDILHGGKVVECETKRITKQGTVINVLYSASVIVDGNNGQKSVAATERDITQHKLADEKILELNADLQKNIARLQLTNQELESFSYSVSHDLRAPLRSLNGNVKIIEEDYGNIHEDVMMVFKRIKHNAVKMERLIDDLLALSKVGKTEIEKAPTDMADLVKKSLRAVNESIPNTAAIEVNSLLPAFADRSLLWQVWTNLISNAVKYSGKKENPKIEIGSLNKDNSNVYFIKDNGVGFDMAYSHKLFGPFQRLHRSTEFEGTGIGLAIVNRIVSKHNGKVWAESKPGEGATFYFTIPTSN